MEASSGASSYEGPERRRHRVYVTHNTEYHTRDGVCIAVRDRRTGAFVTDHHALGHKMVGALHRAADGRPPFREAPEPGDQVVFDDGRMHHVITSAVERVTRPPRELTARYR
jgi:hypothetical protein